MGTRTRTVAFTDLANYTAAVSRSDREALRKILHDHEQLVAPVVTRFGGRVVKNLGDSFMILFDSATDALRSALELQDIIVSTGGISMRVAMTTGDVEEIDGDAFGESVNLAARILSKAPAGEIWFGAGTRHCMNAAEIPWDSVGRFTLKGIPGEQEVFRAVPRHRAWLPDTVAAAVKAGNLVRIQRGQRPPLLPPEPIILLEGFAPGSPALAQAVDNLPVLDPASLYLAAYNIAPSDRVIWVNAGRGLVIGTPDALDAAIDETLKAVSRATGSDTIVLDVGTNAELEVVLCGLALPAVPLSDVVASYSYDLLPDGRWVNKSDRAILRVDVSASAVRVVALAPGASVDGRSLRTGEAMQLWDGAAIQCSAGSYSFTEVESGYAGILVADTEMRLGVADGQTVELGREPNHPGLAFPDRRGQDNIRWCSGPRAARARAGGFTLDRALAGRHQSAITLQGEQIRLKALHARCPTYVLRDGARSLARTEREVLVQADDLIIAGTTVVALRQPE